MTASDRQDIGQGNFVDGKKEGSALLIVSNQSLSARQNGCDRSL